MKQSSLIYMTIFGLFMTLSSLTSYGHANVIVFGDSLSDIGNVPMTSNVHPHSHPSQPPANVYVPISNPVVVSQTGTYSLITHPGIQLHYPATPPGETTIKQLPMLQHKLRQHRSIGWPEYFVMDIFGKHQAIVPSMSLHAMKDPSNISVDYAFSSAMSFDGCGNWLYQHPHQACTLTEISHTNRVYEKYQVAEAKHLAKSPKQSKPPLLIPGLLKQVNLFTNDIHKKHIDVNHNTLYIVMIGGNDINHAHLEIKSGKWRNVLKGIRLILQTSIANTHQAIIKLLDNPIHAQHIIVVNLYDFGLVPGVYHQRFLSWIYHSVSVIYDKRQQSMIMQLRQRYPQRNIRLFNARDFTNKMAKSRYFKSSLGQRCDSSASYYSAQDNPANCYLLQQQPHSKKTHQSTQQAYLFWNRYHFSTVYYQVLAYSLAQFALSHHELKAIQVNA